MYKWVTYESTCINIILFQKYIPSLMNLKYYYFIAEYENQQIVKFIEKENQVLEGKEIYWK